MKIQQTIFSLSLNRVGIYLRDGPFSTNIRAENLRPPKRTFWVAYMDQKYFHSDGGRPPVKLSEFTIKRNGCYCLVCEYKIQGHRQKIGSYFAACF